MFLFCVNIHPPRTSRDISFPGLLSFSARALLLYCSYSFAAGSGRSNPKLLSELVYSSLFSCSSLSAVFPPRA